MFDEIKKSVNAGPVTYEVPKPEPGTSRRVYSIDFSKISI
jgi:hypothetical protein